MRKKVIDWLFERLKSKSKEHGLFGKGRAFDAVGIGGLTAGTIDNLKDIEKLKEMTFSKHETSVMKKKRKDKEKKIKDKASKNGKR